MNKYGKEYIHRINRVIDYIEAHLDSELKLETLAEVANFSPFHFHRIFRVFTGETLSDFIRRMRLSRAASYLLKEADTPVAEIAYRCGFSSQSVFCRNFRDQFNCTPGEYRKQKESKNSKNRQFMSKDGKSLTHPSNYVCSDYSLTNNKMLMNAKIEIMELPAMDVIYCRHTGPFNQIGKAYETLFRWAGPRGLLRFPACKTITYYHDDPKVTAEDNIRQSACLTVQEPVKTEGEIGSLRIPGGKHVVGHFEILPEEFTASWDAVCVWLAESGFQPGDSNPFELYHNNHEDHPEKKFIVDICIPVKPLS